jgi:hypothetical protein
MRLKRNLIWPLILMTIIFATPGFCAAGEMQKKNLEPAMKSKLEEGREKLSKFEKLKNYGALLFKVQSEDRELDEARVELHWTGGGRGGYRPDSVQPNDPKLYLGEAGQSAKLRIFSPGYHEFNRSFVFRRGEVLVWNKIILEPVTRENSATIKGTIELEDQADPNGIQVKASDRLGATDKSGIFTLPEIRSGEVRVRAYKPGYHGLYTSVKVDRGETATCKMKGYRSREAHVKWVYQPDGSREFTNKSVVHDTAVLKDGELDRVDIGEGFKNVKAKSDFLIYQKADKLRLKNFDVRGAGGPAIYKAKKSFNAIKQAPEFSYTGEKFTLDEGDVFVFRCYDGEHFAKLKVVKIRKSNPGI